MYVSSKDHPGKVLAVRDGDYKVVRELSAPGMVPANLAAFSQILYVVEQVQGMVHTFNIVTGEYLGPIIKAEDVHTIALSKWLLRPAKYIYSNIYASRSMTQ